MRLLLLCLLVPLLKAQTAPVTAPDLIVVAGANYKPYAQGKWEGWGALGMKVASTRLYSFTSIDLEPHTAAVRTGGAYLAYQKGGASLLALVDAGAQVNAVTLGTFSGGAIFVQQLKGSWNLVIACRLNAVNATSVTPEVRMAIGRTF